MTVTETITPEVQLTGDGETTSATELRAAARSAYRESLRAGSPLSGVQLGDMFNRSARWGTQRIKEVRDQAQLDLSDDGMAEDDRHDEGNSRVGDPAAGQEERTKADSPVATTEDVGGAVRWITTAAVVVVALVAAIVSFEHMRELSAGAGEGWRSWLIPLTVDGVIVAASMTMVVRRRRGKGGGALAWTALLIGILASLAANVAASEPTVVARLVAAWPPVALVLAHELLMSQIKLDDDVRRKQRTAARAMKMEQGEQEEIR